MDQKQLSFLQLYEPVHESLVLFCRAITGNITDAEDLVQETILNVLERFDRIRDPKAFKAYLFSIASNLWKMKLRKEQFRIQFTDKELKTIIDTGSNPEAATDFKLIYEKMMTLPPKTSEALILFHLSDLSLKEIQKIQGGSLSGVKLRLTRGREKLLKMLETPLQVNLALILMIIKLERNEKE